MTLWLVGHVTDEEWTVVGVFDDHDEAVAHCRDANYFLGPLTLNEATHQEAVWEGAYFPRLEPRPL